MILHLPPPPPSSYRMVEELREPMATASVQRVSVDDLPVEEALLSKLGARGWGRVHHFRNLYNRPWGEKGNAPVSPRAFEALSLFITAATFPEKKLPSVFLTDNGGLELVWEDAAGKSRQVEFKSDGIEYYLAATEEEGSCDLDGLPDLVRKLTT